MTRALHIFLPFVLVGCSSADRDLSATIIFESATECRLTLETRRIFGAFEHNGIVGDPQRMQKVEIAGLGALQPKFIGPDEEGMVHAELPLKGSWHGLTIRALGQGFVPGSGVGYRHLVFAEPPETARKKLNELGFDLPQVTKAREFGDGMTEYIMIRRRGGGSALECGT
jgi:hypothetical protein